jgi:hypothetical protein
MSAVVALQGFVHTQFVGISMIYFRAKVYLSSFNSSLVIAIEAELKKFANGRDVFLQSEKELPRQI